MDGKMDGWMDGYGGHPSYSSRSCKVMVPTHAGVQDFGEREKEHDNNKNEHSIPFHSVCRIVYIDVGKRRNKNNKCTWKYSATQLVSLQAKWILQGS